ncbi:MAG: hypothetical protein WC505_07535 [Patescibacteria group bacterium]
MDLLAYGALRQTGCSEKKLKITRALYTTYEPSCEGCNGGEARFVATCEGRTWTCKQSAPSGPGGEQAYQNDLMTECIEIVAKPRRAEGDVP